jgi:hypothetical protein
MRVSYTLAEINSTNALTNSMLVAGNQPFQMPNKFADLNDACLFFKNMEKKGKKSTTINVWVRGEYLVFEFDEEVYISIAGVLTRHAPTIFGFLTSLRGLFMMFKSTMTSLKNDLKSIK